MKVMDTVATGPYGGTLVGKISKSEGPAPEKWDAHRAKIADLYKNNTLKVVRAIMQRDHDFIASEKMYKTRIMEWGLDKKRKAGEMSLALRTIEQRKAEGKNTCVVIRERTMSERDVRNYFKRQKTSVAPKKLPKNGAAGRLPSHIRSFTPPYTSLSEEAMDETGSFAYSIPNKGVNSCLSVENGLSMPLSSSRFDLEASCTQSSKHVPFDTWTEEREGFSHDSSRNLCHLDLLQRMSLSGDNLIPLPSLDGTSYYELALTELTYYYAHYFKSSNWEPWVGEHLSGNIDLDGREATPRGLGSRESHTPGKRKVMFPHIEFEDPGWIVANVEVATLLYGTSYAKEGDLLMDAAFEKLGILLQEEHPQFLSCFLLLLAVFDSAGLFGLANKLLFHSHDLSQVILGVSHPITRLNSWLAHGEDRDGLVDRAFECIITLYRGHTGHLHPQYLETLHNKAWVNLRRGRYSEAQEELAELQRLYEKYASPTDSCVRSILYSMAQVHIAQKSFLSADFLLAEVQRRITSKFGEETPTEMGFECARIRAVLKEHQGIDIDSRDMITQTVNKAEKVLGDENPFLILMKFTLLR
jgi:hypothetical protein